MRHFLPTCLGLVLCLLMSSGRTFAAPGPDPGPHAWAIGNQGHGRRSHGRGHYEAERSRVAFSAHDREVIRNYFREYPSSLPPGLAKRGGDLPPGLEKHLRRHGTLPPGLEKRLRSFPARLSHRLPPLPVGYSRMMLGTRLLILNRTNVIVDIMFVTR